MVKKIYKGGLTLIDQKVRDIMTEYCNSKTMIQDHANFFWALIDYKIRKGSNTEVQLKAIQSGFKKHCHSIVGASANG